MCHQSVGLIARALETAGIATVSLTSAWSITASANPPRAVYTDFPLGHTAGPPSDSETQRAIVRDALAAISTITEPGTIIPLGYEWPEPWRHEARVPEDHRGVRYDTPQYQTEADRTAAIAAHGQTAACTYCAP